MCFFTLVYKNALAKSGRFFREPKGILPWQACPNPVPVPEPNLGALKETAWCLSMTAVQGESVFLKKKGRQESSGL